MPDCIVQYLAVAVKAAHTTEPFTLSLSKGTASPATNEHHRSSGCVCDEAGGKPVGKIRTAYENAVKRAASSDFTFHDLRHTFTSHLVMAGVDLYMVGQLLGHKSPEMTARYSHLSPERKREAIALLQIPVSEMGQHGQAAQPQNSPKRNTSRISKTGRVVNSLSYSVLHSSPS